MSKVVDWIKQHILRQKRSNWIKREVKITYWTRRDAPAFIAEIGKIRFTPLRKQEIFYVDSLEVST